ncbi:MAG: hypothetical protein LBM69_09315 [Lachnospiraceae bacterium]|jgi:hypothetical protein|nr:hypothetical protein [Lachnospiraceae bacterium]
MRSKTEEITKKVEDSRSASNTNHLTTDRFVIFLLYGNEEYHTKYLLQKVKEIIDKREACVFLEIPKSAKKEDSVSKVLAEIQKASNEHLARVTNYIDIQICSLIFGTKADWMTYESTTAAIAEGCVNRALNLVNKPFLILDTWDAHAAEWLTLIGENTKATVNGIPYNCRCCVLTDKDENAKGVAVERLLTTVLMIALLHAEGGVRASIGNQIGYRPQQPQDFFYTAQSVFIINPLVIRTFTRMRLLLEKQMTPVPVQSRKAISLDFIGDIIQQIYEKCPKKKEEISLLPLYSVMPDPNGNVDLLKRRLENFAADTYVNVLSIHEEEKKQLFKQISEGIVAELIRTGGGSQDIQALKNDAVKIGNICNQYSRAVRIGSLPGYPSSSGRSKEERELYDGCARGLRNKLQQEGKTLLEEYFRSDEFITLSQKVDEANIKLGDIKKAFQSEIDRKEATEFFLKLSPDPDDIWIGGFDTKDYAKKHGDAFAKLALADQGTESSSREQDLADELFTYARLMTGGNADKIYMDEISVSCQNQNTNTAQAFVQKIGDALCFPIRLQDGILRAQSETYTWGDQKNHLYTALQNHLKNSKMNNNFLSQQTDEHFVVTRISNAFKQNDIVGILQTDGVANSAPKQQGSDK